MRGPLGGLAAAESEGKPLVLHFLLLCFADCLAGLLPIPDPLWEAEP